jgi:hypothetical protein
LLCLLDQLSQLLAGIKHAGLHGGGRDAEYLRAFIHRHLMVVDEVDDLPMFQGWPGQCLAQKLLDLFRRSTTPLQLRAARTPASLAGCD